MLISLLSIYNIKFINKIAKLRVRLALRGFGIIESRSMHHIIYDKIYLLLFSRGALDSAVVVNHDGW